MKRVTIECPFRADTAEELRENIAYARLCMLDSLERGEAPFASHLLYPQVWTEEKRHGGILAGLAWMAAADLRAFYLDLGLTSGMRIAFEAESAIDVESRALWPHAAREGRRVYVRERMAAWPELGRLA